MRRTNYGIEIQYLGIEKLGLPESTTEKVFEQMTAERAGAGQRNPKPGRQAGGQHPGAGEQRQRQNHGNDADAQAKVIQSEGRRLAADQFKVFEQNPELANFLLRLDALKTSLENHATLIFSSQTQPFNLLQGLTNAPAKK